MPAYATPSATERFEAAIRWWQQRVRTLRYHVKIKYGIKLAGDHVMWVWAQAHAAMVTSTFRQRADGRTAWETVSNPLQHGCRDL